MTEFHPHKLLQVLEDHAVRYVIIGGVAANALGSPSVTLDLDICYDRSRDNLERLAAALADLQATVRGVPRDLPSQRDAQTIAMGDSFTFDTTAGPFDILATPPGSKGYDELVANAIEVTILGVRVSVASVEDLIRMKRAAGRPKDRVELEILGALRDELESQDD